VSDLGSGFACEPNSEFSTAVADLRGRSVVEMVALFEVLAGHSV
jgi:hypothetical protein